MMPANDQTARKPASDSRVPKSGARRRRTKKAISAELDAAYQLINQLRNELDRFGTALENQRSRYEALLADERREHRLLQETRAARAQALTQQIERLRDENEKLRGEHAELEEAKAKACDGYHTALTGLRRAFEQRLRDDQHNHLRVA